MTPLAAVSWSVLDLATVGEGQSVGDALRASIELARHAERLGYLRYWVAEHHGAPGIASSAPAVLIAHIAEATSTLRVGSGGVMLPNHAPLAIAEQFGMLEALHPGRIDLGVGRAPGTDQLAAFALRRSMEAMTADDFPERLAELAAFFRGAFPADHPFGRITAVPGEGQLPSIWLLGSSDFSASLAGKLGLPFSFAHHFSPENTLPALAAYRASFRPSSELAAPRAMVAVAVVCAENDERAKWQAGPGLLAFVQSRAGRRVPLPTPEDAAAYRYSAAEERLVAHRIAGMVVGGPERVRAGLEALLNETKADEIMITTRQHGLTDRIDTLQRVAAIVGLRG